MILKMRLNLIILNARHVKLNLIKYLNGYIILYKILLVWTRCTYTTIT